MINREQFLHHLELLEPGLASREIVEQSSMFCFEDGKIFTFNEEVACSIPSMMGKEITGAVQSKPLLALLRKFRDEEIDITAVEGDDERHDKLVVAGHNDKVRLLMDREVLLSIASIEQPREWVKLKQGFAEAVKMVKDCTSHDTTKVESLVHFTPNWIEASDTFQACRVRLRTGFAEPALARGTAVKHLPTLGLTDMAETQRWFHFKNADGLVLSCRRWLEDFPDLDQMFSGDGEEVTLPRGLAHKTECAAVFTEEDTENNLVLVELMPGKVRVKGQGVSGDYRGWRKLAYEGRSLAFYVSPELFQKILKEHNVCKISQDKILVNGGNYTYLAVLRQLDAGEE